MISEQRLLPPTQQPGLKMELHNLSLPDIMASQAIMPRHLQKNVNSHHTTTTSARASKKNKRYLVNNKAAVLKNNSIDET